MNKSNINEQSAGTEADSITTAQNHSVSQPNANTNVVGSLFKSREIKFRAWDGEKMVVINDIVFSGNNPKAFWRENSVTEFSEIIMQYTGLKDKNGKEIYEGDIVLIVGQLVAEIFFDIYEGVKIKYHSENVRTKIIGRMIEPIARNHHFTHEVIGNIFENSELLQVVR